MTIDSLYAHSASCEGLGKSIPKLEEHNSNFITPLFYVPLYIKYLKLKPFPP